LLALHSRRAHGLARTANTLNDPGGTLRKKLLGEADTQGLSSGQGRLDVAFSAHVVGTIERAHSGIQIELATIQTTDGAEGHLASAFDTSQERALSGRLEAS